MDSKIIKYIAAAGLSGTLATAAAIIAQFEGKSNTSYLDPVQVWTICYGETKDIKEGMYKTDEECLDSLAADVVSHNKDMLLHVSVPLSDQEHIAYLSFTYNVGVSAFSSSTLLKKLNSGDREGACRELLRWDKAGGKVLRGLVNRRNTEYELCIDGLKREVSNGYK